MWRVWSRKKKNAEGAADGGTSSDRERIARLRLLAPVHSGYYSEKIAAAAARTRLITPELGEGRSEGEDGQAKEESKRLLKEQGRAKLLRRKMELVRVGYAAQVTNYNAMPEQEVVLHVESDVDPGENVTISHYAERSGYRTYKKREMMRAVMSSFEGMLLAALDTDAEAGGDTDPEAAPDTDAEAAGPSRLQSIPEDTSDDDNERRRSSGASCSSSSSTPTSWRRRGRSRGRS